MNDGLLGFPLGGPPAVGSPAAMVLIGSIELENVAASVTFSSIPSTYKHLLVKWQARCDNAVAANTLLLRMNADTGANYDYAFTSANATFGGTSAVAQTSVRFGTVQGTSAAANVGAAGTLQISNYKGTTFYKTFHAQLWRQDAATTGGSYVESSAGHWKSTVAVTSLTILPSAGNFVVGSRFDFYGAN